MNKRKFLVKCYRDLSSLLNVPGNTRQAVMIYIRRKMPYLFIKSCKCPTKS